MAVAQVLNSKIARCTCCRQQKPLYTCSDIWQRWQAKQSSLNRFKYCYMGNYTFSTVQFKLEHQLNDLSVNVATSQYAVSFAPKKLLHLVWVLDCCFFYSFYPIVFTCHTSFQQWRYFITFIITLMLYWAVVVTGSLSG